MNPPTLEYVLIVMALIVGAGIVGFFVGLRIMADLLADAKAERDALREQRRVQIDNDL